ncbi:MAG: ribosome silencing factor [Planctomycetes bacterium]|nr:ribosome silencing factor [Planctomycetota bacterium]
MKKSTDTSAACAVERKNRELALLAAQVMHDQRAEEVLVLDMRGLVDYADFFVVGSASSLVRMRGIARQVEKALAKNGGIRLNRPDRDGTWILADFGDILLHIFDVRARDFYRIEDLWGDAPRVEWKEWSRKDDRKT